MLVPAFGWRTPHSQLCRTQRPSPNCALSHSHGQKCQTKVKSWSIEKMVGSLWNFKHPVQTRNHTAISQPGRKEVVKGEAFPQHKMEKQPGSKPKGDRPFQKTGLRGRVKIQSSPPKPSVGLSFSQWFLRELNHTALREIHYWGLNKKRWRTFKRWVYPNALAPAALMKTSY